MLAVIYRIFVLLLSVLALRKGAPAVAVEQVVSQPYVFLFPVYKEQKIIEETFQYYEQFLAHSTEISLLFVSSGKETEEPSTHTLIVKYIQKSLYATRIQIITSADRTGTKATQLNVGLAYLKNHYSQGIPRIVCFDCDARISWQDFLAADQYVQAHADCSLFSFMPKAIINTKSFIVKALMLHHLERMLAFELSSVHLSKNFWQYPMGATMIVLPELWQKINQFPEPIDDIPLSYILSWQHIAFTTLPFYTLVQAPPNRKNAFRQMIPIFKGVFSYFSTARNSNKTELIHLYDSAIALHLRVFHLLCGVFLYVFFLLEFVSIAAVVLCFNSYYWSLLILFCFQSVVDLWCYKQLTFVNVLLHLSGYFLRLVQFFYFLWRGVLFQQQLNTYKTERS